MYKEELEKLKSGVGELVSKAGEIGKFVEYVKLAESPSTLDTKTKELVTLGIAIGVRCEPCIIWHTKAAIDAGATEEEILDVIKVAVCMGGGPGMMYALKAYNVAKEFLGK